MTEQTTDQPAPRKSFQERQTEIAVTRTREAQARREQAREVLGLQDRHALGELIEVEVLDGNVLHSFVAEVTTSRGGESLPTAWMIAAAKVKSYESFPTRDTALLALVEARHTATSEAGYGWVYAARALGVPTTNEEN